MSEEKSTVAEMISSLKRQRDELALQIHLGAAEAKDEFDKCKDKIDKMTADFEPVKEAVEESASNVLASLNMVGEEVVASFDRIRKSLQ